MKYLLYRLGKWLIRRSGYENNRYELYKPNGEKITVTTYKPI